MAQGEPGPVLPELRWTLSVIAVLVFLVGIPLILLASKTGDYFAWTIHPALTAAWLGGVYWASCAGVWAASRRRLWADARSILPAAFTFTTLTTIAIVVGRAGGHCNCRRVFASAKTS